MIYATREYVQLLATGLSGQSGVTIKEGSGWFTSLKDREITYVMADLHNQPFQVIRGLLLHEIGHVKYSQEAKETPAMKKYGEEMMLSIYNCYEDFRVEYKTQATYGDYAYGSLNDMNFQGIYGRIIENGGNFMDMPRSHQFVMLSAYQYISTVYEKPMDYIGQGAALILEPAQRQYYGFVIDEQVGRALWENAPALRRAYQDIVQATNSHEVQDIVDARILPLLKPFLDEDAKNQPQQQPKPNQQNQPQPPQRQQSGGTPPQDGGQKQDPQQGSGSGNNNQQQEPQKKEQPQQQGGGQSKPQEKKEEKQEEKKADQSQGGDSQEQQQDQKPEEQSGSGAATGQAPEVEEQPAPAFSIADQLRQAAPAGDPVKAKAMGVFGTRGADILQEFAKPTLAEAKSILAPYTQTLSQRLKDILKEQAATRWSGNHLSGRLLGKNAFKVLVRDESRIFSKRNNPDTPKYSVHIAVDASGSMQGGLASAAFMGAVLMQNTSKELGFDTHLYRYDTSCTEIKTMDEYDATGGGTNDSSAFKKILQNIKRAGTTNNLIFVITDGDTGRTSDHNMVVKDLKAYESTIIGLGIGSGISESTMKQNYEIPIRVKKVDELPLEMISVMRRLIHR